jgi:hypothetical protein
MTTPKPMIAPLTTKNGTGKLFGAKGTIIAPGPTSAAPKIDAPPTPSHRRRRSACVAPTSQPTAPSEAASPINPEDIPSVRCA